MISLHLSMTMMAVMIRWMTEYLETTMVETTTTMTIKIPLEALVGLEDPHRVFRAHYEH
jgi:hypothetical protein